MASAKSAGRLFAFCRQYRPVGLLPTLERLRRALNITLRQPRENRGGASPKLPPQARGQPIRSRRARRRDPVTPRRDNRRNSNEQIYRLHLDDVCAAARDRARRRVRLVADEIFSGTRRRCLSGLQNLSLPARSKNSTTPSTPHVARSVSEATASRIDLAPPNLSMLRTDGAPDSDAVRASIGAQAAPSLVATTRTARSSFSMASQLNACTGSFMTRDNSTAAYPRPPSLFRRQIDITFPSSLVPCHARRFLQTGHGFLSTTTACRPKARF